MQRRVDWDDTDAAGHQHFTAILRWAEQAEHLLCERLGIYGDTAGRMPRVRLEVDFMRRLAPREIVSIELSVARVGRSSVVFEFEIHAQAELAAKGSVVAAFAPQAGAVPLPDALRQALLTGGEVAGERYAAVPAPGVVSQPIT